jgi:hypothetical protein
MDELTAFVKARLDEDEAAASRNDFEHWQQDAPATGLVLVGLESLIECHIAGLAEHIARHDPARVLREVEAKRKRLALYLDAKEALAAALKNAPPDSPATAHSYVRERINVNQASGRFTALETSVRLDAMAWSDHPDYRQEWKP